MAEPKYQVVIHPSRDVTLRGSADGDFWTRRLVNEKLVPRLIDGRAQLWITATESRFNGLRFRELTIAVLVDSPADLSSESVFLISAFNSIRWFAWVERTLFAAPYRHGQIEVEPTEPLSIGLRTHGEPTLDLRMGANEHRSPFELGEQAWAGAVILPKVKQRSSYFPGRIAGQTRMLPFDPHQDHVLIRPTSHAPELAALVESGFVGHEWHVRTGGSHGKGKTIRRA